MGDYCIRFGGQVGQVEADGEQVQAIPATRPAAKPAAGQTWVQTSLRRAGRSGTGAKSDIPAAKCRGLRMTGWME